MRNLIKDISCLLLSYIIIMSCALPSFNLNTNEAQAAKDDDWSYTNKNKCSSEEATSTENKEENSKDEKKDSKTDVSGKGDWLDKGSEKYKVAEDIYNHLTEEYGTSGAFAAGVLANIKGESDFIPDRSQGAGEIRIGMTTKEPKQNEGGGAGIVQFTPYTKFTNSKYWKDGEGWKVENQIDALWDMEFKDKSIMNYAASTNKAYGVASYGKEPPFKELEEWMKTDDPVKSAIAFQGGYERPQDYHDEREDYAKQADKVFNKDKKEADESKWKIDGKSSKTKVETKSQKESDSSDDDTSKKEEDCQDKVKKKKKEDKEGSVASWGKDGTGKAGVSFDGQKFYKKDDLPKSLKKYALDPAALGLGWKSDKNWANYPSAGFSSGGQCTNFSISMISNVWEKDGKSILKSGKKLRSGNGNQTTSYLSDDLGGSDSNKPSKGAVFSAKPGSEMGPTGYGHTGVVSHVFENGDVLLVEQNLPGYSGDENNEPHTWNYRLIDKKLADSMKYYSPEKQGYKPSSKLK